MARSLTTPTSRTRSGNGPMRSVATRKTWPSCPSATRRRSSSSAGLKRSTWPTAAGTPAASTASIRRRASAAVAASGFSTSTGTPVGHELLDRRDVLLGGHRDDREVERPGREQRADRAEDEVLVADGGEPVPVGIDGAGERRPRRGLQQPRVVAADHAQPEDGAARGALGRAPARRALGYPPWPIRPLRASSSAPTASVGRDVVFGANVVVHDGVVLGDGVVVQDAAILGKPPRLSSRSQAAADPAAAARGRGRRGRLRAGDPLRRRPRRARLDRRGPGRRPRARPRGRRHRGRPRDAHRQRRRRGRPGAPAVERLPDRAERRRGRRLRRSLRDDDERPHDVPPRAGGAPAAAPCSGGRAASAAPPCSSPASRSARRPSSPPAPWSPTTSPARAVVLGVPARQVRQVPDEDLLERWT